MADLSKTVAIIFNATNNTGTALGGVEQGLKGLGTEADASAKNLDGLSDGLKKVGDSKASIDLAVDGLKALAGALVVKEFIDANVEAEKFDRAMTQLTGSSTLAADEFKYVKTVSNLLGTELFSTADAYVQLTAATKGTGLEGQATRDIFEAVATAMGKLGKDSADTEGALLAISQMVSKGTVSLEELRGQLGERMPGAFKIAADAMGVTTQELDALVSSGKVTAEDFLPKFAKALKDTFGDTTYIDGYQAAWNRLQNSLSDAYIELGKSGAMDALTKGVELATAAVVGAVAAFQVLGEIAGAVAGAIATGDFSGLGDAIAAAMARGAEKTQGVRDALFDADTKAKDLKYSGEQAGAAVADGMEKAALSADDLKKATSEADKALKALGIDPKQFKDPLAEVLAAFSELSTNPVVTGEQFLSGLLVTLDKLKKGDDLGPIVQGIADAYKSGKLGADEYAAAVNALETKQSGLWDQMIRSTDAANKQGDATKDGAKYVLDTVPIYDAATGKIIGYEQQLVKAADAANQAGRSGVGAADSARKMATESDKAADAQRKWNEELTKMDHATQLKLIEQQTAVMTESIKADAVKVQAAFESINTTIESTGDLLGTLFKTLASPNLDWSSLQAIHSQIEIENDRRGEALELQKQMTTAQVDLMRAQTRALASGEGLIKIDGAGLKPHLEAFMWEILQAIQVRVNQDGLKMLLGVA